MIKRKTWVIFLLILICIYPLWKLLRFWGNVDMFAFDTVNESHNLYRDVHIGTPGVSHSLPDACEGCGGLVRFPDLDPTFYMHIEFVMPNGESKSRHFFRFIPWNKWLACARGTEYIHIIFKEDGKIETQIDNKAMTDFRRDILLSGKTPS